MCTSPIYIHMKAYEPHIFWWEMLEMGRKFFLVAVAVRFGPGSVMQLVWGILVTVTFLCLRFEAQPYRSSAADHLAFSVDVFLVMVPLQPCNPSALQPCVLEVLEAAIPRLQPFNPTCPNTPPATPPPATCCRSSSSSWCSRCRPLSSYCRP